MENDLKSSEKINPNTFLGGCANFCPISLSITIFIFLWPASVLLRGSHRQFISRPLSPDELPDEHLPEVGLVLSGRGVLQGDHGPGHRGQAGEEAGGGVGHAHQPRAPTLRMRREEGEGVRQAARGVRGGDRGRRGGARGVGVGRGEGALPLPAVGVQLLLLVSQNLK